MKIRDVRATPLHTTERSLAAGPGACLVRIETDNGIIGVGEGCTQSEHDEASLSAQVIIERGLKPLLVGEDPLNIRRLWEKMYLWTEWFGRAGITMYAISGVDIALWDIMGKALDISVSRLLGGRFREDIPVYASILFDMENFAAMADEAKQWTREGYAAVKFGWGQTRATSFGLDPKKDETALKYLRDELGPEVKIMVDVGRYVNWSGSHALKMARTLAAYDISWLEEPLPQDDVDGYVRLTQLSPVRIATGEGEYNRFGFKELITRRAVDIVQPDICRCGGLTEGMRVADLVQAWNLTLVPHGFSTAVNVAANLQWVSAMASASLLEFRRTQSPLIFNLGKPRFEAKQGRLAIPDKPGLGIEIDQSVVEECTVRTP
ncbi:MAG TPA: mandelate racemase/muconate lactonizing enzyme family protein [Terriglobales bacterium]|nr:mandelate racemase/muconate lactonizing enzyme family protein [Terriglobales bacterium]